MRHPVVRQHRAVQRMKQLGAAELDGVAEVPRQPAQEAVQLLGPGAGVGKILPPHRLELEHEARGVIHLADAGEAGRQ